MLKNKLTLPHKNILESNKEQYPYLYDNVIKSLTAKKTINSLTVAELSDIFDMCTEENNTTLKDIFKR